MTAGVVQMLEHNRQKSVTAKNASAAQPQTAQIRKCRTPMQTLTACATWQTLVQMARELAVTFDVPGSSGDWTHILLAGQVVASSLLLLSAPPRVCQAAVV